MAMIGISIGIPQPFAEHLRDARRRAGDQRADAIPPHVTLMPPTDVAEADREALNEHLIQVAGLHRPFAMLLRGTGTFRPTSDVVFVAIAGGGSSCERIESDVRDGPVSRPLQFPYHPHVTVAHDVPQDGLDRVFNELSGFEANFVVGGFDLHEQGVDEIWRPVRRFHFG